MKPNHIEPNIICEWLIMAVLTCATIGGLLRFADFLHYMYWRLYFWIR